MARRKFARLKALMYEQEITQADLVPVMGHGTTYISERLNGKQPWDTDGMRAVGNLLGIPRDQWLDYFMEE